MFAVMVECTDGKVFKIFETMEQAQNYANNVSCMGYAVTVFDYDMESKVYLEFYQI